MSSTSLLSVYLNLMFTSAHLVEIIRLGQSAQRRLDRIFRGPEQWQNPHQLWFIEPHYLLQFVTLGQQAQKEQDTDRTISLEAAVHALSPRSWKHSDQRTSGDSSFLTVGFESPITRVIDRNFKLDLNNEGLAELEGRESVALEVIIWIIDNLQHQEEACTTCGHGETVREYGGGYFDNESTPTQDKWNEYDCGAKAGYAIKRGFYGNLVLYQI
jgi:hypothetical protein